MKAIIAITALAIGATSGADIRYSLSVDEPARSIRISMRFEPRHKVAKVAIPKWCPGFYVLKNYDEKVSDVRANDETGKSLIASREGSEWTIQCEDSKEVIVSYRVLGDDGGLGFFGTSVRPNLAFVNGPSAFMYLDGRKNEPCLLKIEAKEGTQIATAMPENGINAFRSGDYDELIDHPIQIGAMARRSFSVGSIPFEVAVASINGRYPNMDRLSKDLERLSLPSLKMFGSAPFKKYLYLVHLGVGDFAGGLEHRASNTIAVDFDDPLQLGTLAIHEFFHAWNVKQIRPAVLGPFDYTAKVRTRNLWWSEGVTEYYANLHAIPAGIYDEGDLIWAMGSEIDTYQRSTTRSQKTLEDICLNTWESSGFGFGDLSYYTSGAIVGLILDAAILDATDGVKSLDDVMKLLYDRHRLPKPGFGEDDLRKVVNEVAGTDLTVVYNQCVRSTNMLPFEKLRAIGLEVYRPGDLIQSDPYDLDRRSLVDSMSPEAQLAGLRLGDRIVEDSSKTTSNDLIRTVKVRRGDQLVTLAMPILLRGANAYGLRKVVGMGSRESRLFTRWLRRESESVATELNRNRSTRSVVPAR